ncbi:MAG: hypothetical protein O2999_13150 [Nitrospirae bacterium]|nr:hypothetical protein [Nitrospirota bacterium]MDA1305220.1 hypothetical protein [Nitrospirota bacterium]
MAGKTFREVVSSQPIITETHFEFQILYNSTGAMVSQILGANP